MSWMSALNPWQWGVLLAVPPLVFLLYFLKLRRQSLEVPSTFLWRRAIEDMHVNSLWQRLRRNLLLLLQLLFLAALILACLRPGIHGNQESGRRWILMLDNSASMQATDLATTRLEAAKSKVKGQISQMNRGDVAMLIAFSDRADIQQGFTGDKRRLMAALDRVAETNRTTDIKEALRAAAGLANPGRVSFDGMNDIQVAEALPATVFVYSDGGFPSMTEFDRGNLSIEYIPTGTTAIDNVGIEAFAVSRNEERTDELESFARVANYGSEAISTTASLYHDKNLIDALRVTVEPGKDAGVRFKLEDFSVDSGVFHVELDRADQFLLDNQAYAALRPARTVNVALITPGNAVLEKALTTSAIRSLANIQIESPAVLVAANTGAAEFVLDAFDLVIFDQCKPKAMPNANTLFIGQQPPMEGWKLVESDGPFQFIDVDRSHPITALLEIGNIYFMKSHTIDCPESGQVLMRAENGPVLAVAPRGPFQDAVLGFDILRADGAEVLQNSNWGIKRSFPVFIYGCVEFLSGGRTQSAANTTLPGQPMAISLASRIERFQVTDPKGRTVDVEKNDSGQLIWTSTEDVGVYQISAGTEKRSMDMFAVNLFSPRESNLEVRSSLEIGDEKLTAANVQTQTRKEYWRWLLFAGLVLLVGEWYVYNRRVLV
ncbi:MAG: BatA and WFA domain-containing protein [Pirellulaceae bacterium]|nr:BatA and WFA domain-containing protein [Pirellulaceae bacterium]